MAARPYELLARYAPDGTVAGVSVRNLTTVDGKDYESDPAPLAGTTDPAFTQFATDFSAAVVAERDSLALQVATLTTERDNALAKVAPLEAQVATLAAENEALRNPPFDPRVIAPYSFVQRYTQSEQIAILEAAKTDLTVGLILSQLQTVQRVRLDVEATQQGVHYLASIGVITADRIPAILADATAEEAP